MGKQRPSREGSFSGGERVGVGSQRVPAPQYEPIVTEGNEALVHHMEVFQCAAEFESVPHFSGPCDSKMKPQRLNYCRHVLAAWALGAKVRAPPTSPGGPLRCWSPMALWSHRCLLQPVFLPSWASFSLPVKFHWIWRGLCTGWSWGCPGSIQGLPEASSSSSVVGSLAWGSEPAPPDLKSNRSTVWAGDELPVRGEHPSNLAARQPLPRPCSSGSRGWVCPDPPGPPLVPPRLSSGLSPPFAPLQAFYYPEEAGLAFGGPGSSRFLRLEVHYHNPLVIKGKEVPDTPPFLPASDPPSGARGLTMSKQGSRAGRAQPEPSPPSPACLSPDPRWPVALSASSLPLSCGCGGLSKAHTHAGRAQNLTPPPPQTPAAAALALPQEPPGKGSLRFLAWPFCR